MPRRSRAWPPQPWRRWEIGGRPARPATRCTERLLGSNLLLSASARGDVALAGPRHQPVALDAYLEAVRLAVEFLGHKADQVLTMKFVGDAGEGRGQVTRRRQLEITAAAGQ